MSHNGCANYRALPAISRRDTLQAGVLGGLGVTLSSMLRNQAAGAVSGNAKAKSVILFWLQGGVSHHDTLDPKPDASSDIRGEFSPISTRLPGVQFTEMLPRMASMMDKFAVVRSATHPEAAHERGSMYLVEGRRPGPGANGSRPSGNPEIGSIVAHELGQPEGLPAFFSIPGNDFTSQFIGSGWMPPATAAFKGHQATSLKPSTQLTSERFSGRIDLRNKLLSGVVGSVSAQRGPEAWDQFDDQAVDIIRRGRGGKAFDISEEPTEILKLYGIEDRGTEKCRYALTARRLVEAGARYVTIGRNSWDHHSGIFPLLKRRLPSMDSAIAGLVTDLENRGLLDETLVVYLTEFGRTPKVNSQAGRDHWPGAFSVAFAGAGIRGGQVLGASDRTGGSVADRPVSPEEIAATILHLVGIHPQTMFTKPDGRPIQYVDQARPIAELLA